MFPSSWTLPTGCKNKMKSINCMNITHIIIIQRLHQIINTGWNLAIANRTGKRAEFLRWKVQRSNTGKNNLACSERQIQTNSAKSITKSNLIDMGLYIMSSRNNCGYQIWLVSSHSKVKSVSFFRLPNCINYGNNSRLHNCLFFFVIKFSK